MAQQVKTLNQSDFIDFKTSDEIRCFENSLVEKATYLNFHYNLFNNTNESNHLIKDALQLAFKNESNAKIMEFSCFDWYMILFGACCVNYPNYDQAWSDCVAHAWATWLLCEGA